MTQKANPMIDMTNDQPANVSLRVVEKTGADFQGLFPAHQTTFARVKFVAMQSLFKTNQPENIENYKLISIGSKRTVVDEEKTLREEKIQDGDEFILIRKLSNDSNKVQQASETSPVDEKLIDKRTKDLPLPSRTNHQPHLLTRRTEFRANLTRILLTLIETAHRLLWYRSDAEQIYRQVEKILSQSSEPSEEVEISQQHVNHLIELGFTEQQARFALKRTKSDLNAAMDLLFTDPKIEDENEKQQSPASVYSHQTTFIPFREFRQKYSQPNPAIIQSLMNMGFDRDDTINALRICHNDFNLACDYLIGDKDQRQALIDAEDDQSLEPDSSLFKSLMENSTIQRAVNDPKTFFILLHLYENPALTSTYINDPEIGYLFLQITRIYNTERYQSDTEN